MSLVRLPAFPSSSASKVSQLAKAEHLMTDSIFFYFAASPPSPPTDLTVVEVTSSSVEISWGPPANDGGRHSPTTLSLFTEMMNFSMKHRQCNTLLSCGVGGEWV